MMDFNAITETIMMDLIIGISSNLSETIMGVKSEKSYDRISSVKKIEINNLGGMKNEIENIISKLDVVEKAVFNINQDILCENKFERVKDFVVEKYLELAKKHNGVELYEKLVSEALTYSNDKWNLLYLCIRIYVFNKYDFL